jgi:galactose-1-phosphate uridylyltransferase
MIRIKQVLIWLRTGQKGQQRVVLQKKHKNQLAAENLHTLAFFPFLSFRVFRYRISRLC